MNSISNNNNIQFTNGTASVPCFIRPDLCIWVIKNLLHYMLVYWLNKSEKGYVLTILSTIICGFLIVKDDIELLKTREYTLENKIQYVCNKIKILIEIQQSSSFQSCSKKNKKFSISHFREVNLERNWLIPLYIFRQIES